MFCREKEKGKIEDIRDMNAKQNSIKRIFWYEGTKVRSEVGETPEGGSQKHEGED